MRGQAHTLEATAAGLLMLASLIFALQMTAVTPLSASTSSQHIENQQQAIGQGVLMAADEADALRPGILYWNNSTRQYHGSVTSERGYRTVVPDNEFGSMLERSFNNRGIAYNVYLRFRTTGQGSITRPYIYSGFPSDNAVRASHTVTLTDDDPLYDRDGTPNETRIGDGNATFPIPDTDTDGPHYNTVEVEVVAWRI